MKEITKFSFEKLKLDGAFLISPFFAPDDRGFFLKDYNVDIFKDNGIEYNLKETFYSFSQKGTLRGFHYQLIKPQPKLVRCLSGHVFDVIVDLRPGSSTYLQWLGFDLSGANRHEILVPIGFAHGFYAIEDSLLSYKCGEVFYGPGDSGIRFDDPTLKVQWPLEKAGFPLIMSEKDKNLPTLAEFLKKRGAN